MSGVGDQAALNFTVTADDTALAVGSGTLAVLGTPRLVAWLEAATCAAVEATLDPTQTTVGTDIEVSHHAPTVVGDTVTATARLAAVDGRRLTFDVAATDTAGTTVGSGTIRRVVVDVERFLAKLPVRPATGPAAPDAGQRTT